jgi:hypothetical protein
MMIGPLPGVDVAPGAGGSDPGDFDGTPAVTWIYGVWDSLTPEQRSAATRRLTVRAIPGGTNQPRMLSAGFPADIRFVGISPPDFDYAALAKDANNTIHTLMNVPVIEKYIVLVSVDTPEGTEYAHTWSWNGDNPKPEGCEIVVWNSRFTGLTPDDAKAIMTHEMFHCYQQRVEGSRLAANALPAWIAEGQATWVMAAIVPTVDDKVMQDKWSPYVEEPQQAFYKRSYDAVGVFGHMSDIAGNSAVWSALLPMIPLGVTAQSTSALNLLLQGQDVSYYSSWGSSYFRLSDRPIWNIQGPGMPSAGTPPATVMPLLSGEDIGLYTAAPFANQTF